MNMKAGEPIDHKLDWSFNSQTKQYQVWNPLEKLDPEYVLITNPSPNAWNQSIYKFCLDVMRWQSDRKKGFLVTLPPDSGFAHFLKRYTLNSRKWDIKGNDKIKLHLANLRIDMTKYCGCDPSISQLIVYFNHDDDFELMEPEYALNKEGKLWTDPQWRVLPSRYCSFLARFTELVPMRDMRQNFLVDNLLELCDGEALRGASMFLDRGAECSCLLQDLHHVETSIPVRLKHILPQKFTTQLLVQILRKNDQLPMSTEASVRDSTDSRIIELIPGLQDIRHKILPQMYFKDCSVFRGTYGRADPLFQHPEDALTIWKPGGYDRVYFMFVSQLYPHREHFKTRDWSMIGFSRETTGAIRRRVNDPRAQGNVRPDEDDPMHPDQLGGDLPPEGILSGDEPDDPLDVDNQSDYNTGPDPDDNDDDQECIIPDDYGPPPDDDLDMPGIQDSWETHNPSTPSTPFSDPDVPIEQIADPGQDDDLSPGTDPTSEPIRVKGNRDRLLLILLMLYQRQRLR